MPRIDLVRTWGTFSLGDERFEVEDNIWIVGDDEQVVVVDAAHDEGMIVAEIAGREVSAIVCTHGHNDHINAAVDLAGAIGAPIAIHPADLMLWNELHPSYPPDIQVSEGDTFDAGRITLRVIHTPGHTPGSICLYDGTTHLFSGDTLLSGGPGATGATGATEGKYSDFPTLIESIKEKLLTLPPETMVYPGHGETTTIGTEAPDLDKWIQRGH